MPPKFFRSAKLFDLWLQSHHATRRELEVGFHKVASGKRSITYPEALDAALCYGWIDGMRRSLDATSYSIRFTPRRPDSIWSAVNVRHVARLEAAGLMQPAGLKAFRERDPKKVEQYSFENRPRRLDPAFAARFKANRRAWTWFEAESPSFRRTATWWVMGAKREETRVRRLELLIACSARGVRPGPFLVAAKDRITARAP